MRLKTASPVILRGQPIKPLKFSFRQRQRSYLGRKWQPHRHRTGIMEEIFAFEIFISLISNRIHHGTKNKSGIQPTIKVDPAAS